MAALRVADAALARRSGRARASGSLRRRRRWLWLSVALVEAAWVGASAVLFVWPATGRPRRVDAVLALNGDNEAAREQRAVSLVEAGYAPVLLFSQGNFDTTACPSVRAVRVVCFEPKPARTIGEIEFAVRAARRHHWHTLMIVAGRAQTIRARLLVARCFGGSATVVDVATPLRQIPYQVLYEWGALAKALFVDRGC